MKCPITGKSCLKHKSFDHEGNLVCEDCIQKNQESVVLISEIKCPSCGTAISDVIKGGRFGCAGCYDNFQDASHIISSVQRAESGARHVGRFPSRFIEEKSRSVSAQEIRDEITMRMNSAASKGDYSVAAKMKSRLKELDSLLSQKDGRAEYADRLARFVMSFWSEPSEGFY